MQSNKAVTRLGLSLLTVAILVPLASSVNHFAKVSREQTKSRSLQADGAPLPPPPPMNHIARAAGGQLVKTAWVSKYASSP